MVTPAGSAILNVCSATGVVFANKMGASAASVAIQGRGWLGWRSAVQLPRCAERLEHDACPLRPAPTAVFSVFQFSFTYALTFIHTIVTWLGMLGFKRVREGASGRGCARSVRGGPALCTAACCLAGLQKRTMGHCCAQGLWAALCAAAGGHV